MAIVRVYMMLAMSSLTDHERKVVKFSYVMMGMLVAYYIGIWVLYFELAVDSQQLLTFISLDTIVFVLQMAWYQVELYHTLQIEGAEQLVELNQLPEASLDQIRDGVDGDLRGRSREMLDKHFKVNKIRKSGTTEELLEAIEMVQQHKEL